MKEEKIEEKTHNFAFFEPGIKQEPENSVPIQVKQENQGKIKKFVLYV